MTRLLPPSIVRRMRNLLAACILSFACASGSKQAPAPAATVMAGSMPSNTPAPEAAAVLSRHHPAAAGDPAPAAVSDDASCATDDDCTSTRLAPGACCPMLCSPRAVTKKEAEALEAHVKSCAMTHPCPQPSCAPPRRMTFPACEKNRCVTKVREAGSPA